MYRSMLLVGLACFVSSAALAEKVQFEAAMDGAKQVPPVTSDGTGTTDATLDTDTKVLTYEMTYSGLSGPATAAHLHGPASATGNAPVLVPFQVSPSPIKGTATLTEAQITDLMDGKVYANLHTAKNPGGEIRGQMLRK